MILYSRAEDASSQADARQSFRAYVPARGDLHFSEGTCTDSRLVPENGAATDGLRFRADDGVSSLDAHYSERR